MTPRRAIVVAFDERFLNPGLVASTTALTNAPADASIVVLGVDLSERAKAQIHQHLPEDRLMLVDAEDFSRRFPSQMPLAAWARLGIHEFLADDIQRVVYIDADTMTRGPINQLFEMSLEGMVMAACIEHPDPTHQGRHDRGKAVHPQFDYLADCPVSPVAAYFNSGVLAIDLELWRSSDAGGRLLELAQTLPKSYVYPDQDLLNTVLSQEWLPLDWETWNFPGLRLDRLAWESHIVHFAGPTKPWKEAPLGAPFSREYRAAARNVGWRIRPTRYRVKAGLLETVLPYSVVLRRKRISRLLDLWIPGR